MINIVRIQQLLRYYLAIVYFVEVILTCIMIVVTIIAILFCWYRCIMLPNWLLNTFSND